MREEIIECRAQPAGLIHEVGLVVDQIGVHFHLFAEFVQVVRYRRDGRAERVIVLRVATVELLVVAQVRRQDDDLRRRGVDGG